MDLLEHQALDDVIVLSVVLDEVKHRNTSVYQRLRKLCADPARRFFVFANENHRCAVPGCLPQPEHTRCSPWLGAVSFGLPSLPVPAGIAAARMHAESMQ